MTGGAAGGAIVDAHIAETPGARKIRHHGDDRHVALDQRVDGLAHQRMLERDEGDALRMRADAQQAFGQHRRIEAFDLVTMPARHVAFKALLDRLHRVAEHVHESVRPHRQQEIEFQMLQAGYRNQMRRQRIVEPPRHLEHEVALRLPDCRRDD